jgi:hypothetical protein
MIKIRSGFPIRREESIAMAQGDPELVVQALVARATETHCSSVNEELVSCDQTSSFRRARGSIIPHFQGNLFGRR